MSSRPARLAHVLASFRWLEVRCMEMLAAWVPSTPEMEVKLLMGEHLYLMARHADALGHRTRELRAPLHHTRPPTEAYVRLVEEVASAESTEERLGRFYSALVPALERRYRAHLEELDPLLDGPTVRIVEEALADLQRMGAQPEAAPTATGRDWARRESAVARWCTDPASAPAAEPDPAR